MYNKKLYKNNFSITFFILKLFRKLAFKNIPSKKYLEYLLGFSNKYRSFKILTIYFKNFLKNILRKICEYATRVQCYKTI
jgi:hypothetical protein